MNHLKYLVFALVIAATSTLQAQTVKFAGSVVDSQGRPVPDATIDVYQYPSVTRSVAVELEVTLKQHANSDATGAFQFSAPSAPTILVAHKSGLAHGWKMINPPAGTTDPIVLAAPSEIAGMVVDERGQPVAGADVWVSVANTEQGAWNQISAKVTHATFSARSAADGRFRIENFPAGGEVDLGVSKAGSAARGGPNEGGYVNGSLPFHAGQTDIKITLVPAATVSGRIVAADGSQPVAGMKLMLQHTGYSPFSGIIDPVTSGADGTFRFNQLSAGNYRIVAFADYDKLPDWIADIVPITLTDGQTLGNVRVAAFKGGVVEVTVRSGTDRSPLAGASVNAYGNTFQTMTATDASGVARLRMPDGQFSISAYKPGFSSANQQVSAQAGRTNRVSVEISPSPKISGRVTDANGNPVAGVRVLVTPNYGGNSDGRTDANGHYEISWQVMNFGGANVSIGVSTAYSLMALDAAGNTATTHSLEPTTTNLDLRLEPGLTLAARVLDLDGKPIADASASIIAWIGDNGSGLGRPFRADSEGRIEIKGLPRGRRFQMNVSARGFGSAEQQIQENETATARFEIPPLTLRRADRKLAGRVLGLDGKGVAGAQVNMNGSGQPAGYAITDTNGNFAFAQVCEGPVSISANYQGMYADTMTSGGNTNAVIRLSRQNVIDNSANSVTTSGQVTDPQGKPVAGVHVTTIPSMGTVFDVTTDVEGKYSYQWQPARFGVPAARRGGGVAAPGFAIVARDPEHNLAALHSIDEKTETQDLRLQPAMTVSGTVQESGGKSLSGAAVTLSARADRIGSPLNQQPVSADADGNYEFNALPPEGLIYTVQATASHHGSANAAVQPNGSPTKVQVQPLVLKIADRQIGGQVLDQNGKPVIGAQIQILGGTGQPGGNVVRSDSQGHFLIQEACEGNAMVYAFGNTGGINTASVQCQGGDTNVVIKFGAIQTAAGGRRGGGAQGPDLAPLKSQSWTLASIKSWPASHRSTLIVLVSVQILLVVAVAGAVLWKIRRK